MEANMGAEYSYKISITPYKSRGRQMQEDGNVYRDFFPIRNVSYGPIMGICVTH